MSDRLPSLTPAEMIKTLEKAGLTIIRQTGSHVIMYKAGLLRPIPVPKHPESLKHSLQNVIIREAGFSTDQFRRFL
jgi:predicted RNA binding protein YcfA (HicA-like mRNA interferase family)